MNGQETFRTVISSKLTGLGSPEEMLEDLDKMGIEWYITEEGTLMIRYWQVGAENFISPEQAGVIRSSATAPEKNDELDWLGKHIDDLRQQYGGQWIAIYNEEVVASAPELPQLIRQTEGYDKLFLTFIPAEPVVWTFTYAH